MSGHRKDATEEIVLVHTSDLHVDDPILPGPYTGLVGLRSVLLTASALLADAVLLAGDTFDNLRVSTKILHQARDLLATANRPVVLLPGNHDPLQPDGLFHRAGLLELPHVHVIGTGDSGALRIDTLDLEIHGLAHRGFSDFPPLRAARPRGARWQVIMAHGHYVPPGEEAAQAHRAWRFDDTALCAAGGDYIALGHWDRPLRVGPEGIAAYYSGAPDLAGTVNVIRLHPRNGVAVARETLIWPAAMQRSPRLAPADR